MARIPRTTSSPSRASLLLAVLLAGAAAEAPGATTPVPPAFPTAPAATGPLSLEQRRQLQQSLARLHPQYDPEARMLARPFSSPGYHTTLTGGLVHPTRDSLRYALACLDTGEATLHGWAVGILERVLALQDQDPASRTYGIWPWFLEEPLARMSPPDWNWADFCGVLLLQVARDHRDRLPPALRDQVDAAILHAARSIQRRNVGPDYTNIAIMGTYVTLVAAERYQLPDLLDYARTRLQRLHAHITSRGALTEYNSPTYTLVALEELARLREHATRAEDRRLVEPLYRIAWEEVATHFHAPTRQWAGPHSRCYSTLLRPDVLAFIEQATDRRVAFGSLPGDVASYRVHAPCPPDLERLFLEPRTAMLVKTFVPGEFPVIGATFLSPAFTLGSVNRGDLWNQRRPLIAYFGDLARPSFLRLRLLRDDTDLAAAQFFSVQHEGRVLAAVNLATDGGLTHVSLDRMKEASFDAIDLRLRFEFGGAIAAMPLTAPRSPQALIDLPLDNLHLRLGTPFARWGDATPRWESGRGTNTAHLDLILHHGARRQFQLADLGELGLGIALALSEQPIDLPPPTAEARDGRLRLHWHGLDLAIPLRPAPAAELRRQVEFAPAPAAPAAPPATTP